MRRPLLLSLSLLILAPVVLLAAAPGSFDELLRARLAAAGVQSLAPLPEASPEQIELGRLLFFDPVLSGNRDVSCATCHHPNMSTSDALALSIGVGGHGLGMLRSEGDGRTRVPRNAPSLFNRGVAGWTSMFWDSRVAGTAETGFSSPAGGSLPPGLESALAVQALFPVTSRDEMRGLRGDYDVLGAVNELAALPDTDFGGIWAALMERLLAIPEYRELFRAAYPELPADQWSIVQAANAIAAFEASAWTLLDSPFDRYLAGDDTALGDAEKRGALLFFGEAGCVGCHSGPLLSDLQHHNLAVPPLGPGKSGGLVDYGRGLLTLQEADRFCFRTPPLRNVAVTGPWMHNGAFTRLEDAVRHVLDPETGLRNYDRSQLEPRLQGSVRIEEEMIEVVLATLDPLMTRPRELEEAQFADLMSFLHALTSPQATSLAHDIPDRVPSGLAVER